MRRYRDFREAWADQGKTILIAAVVIGALVGLVDKFILPPTYKARATILLPSTDLPNQNPLLTVLTATANPIEVLRGVADSHVARTMVSKASGKSMRDLKKDLDIRSSPEEQQILLSCNDRKKDIALSALNADIKALYTLYDINQTSVETSKANALRKEVDAREQDLRKAESELLQISKESNQAIDPSNPYSATTALQKYRENEIMIDELQKQADVYKELAVQRATPARDMASGIEEVEDWRKEYNKDEAALKVARSQYGPDAPQLRFAETQADASRTALDQAVHRNVLAANQGRLPEFAETYARLYVAQEDRKRLADEAASAPGMASRIANLIRQVTFLQGTLADLYKNYEVARTQEETTAVNWSILEQPYIEDDEGSGAITFALVSFVVILLIGMGWLMIRVDRPVVAGLTEL